MLVLNETQADLAAMILADFGRLRPDAAPGRDLVDWLHYRARRVVERPRTVLISDEVRARRAAHPAIDDIATALQIGAPMTRWLSGGIRRRKTDPKADLMFNQSKVSHFHIGPTRQQGARAEQGALILFAHIGVDAASLLDVQPHRNWTRTDLLRILLRTDPKAMHDFGLTREPPLTDEQHKILRRKHTTARITIDGRAYAAPGIALMGSGDGLRFRVMADHLAYVIQRALHEISTNTLRPDLLQRLAGQIGLPVRLAVRLDRGIFVIYDKNCGLDLMQLNTVLA
ncbi:hypothetical protein MKK84_19070 [Methylobacterium sp. E-065]|uniref:hypothetical protein n=1 Tax=Methylobacterium sp. E-065 TaxID=2836583 RepID=UPI001FB9773C|nr:hypothetical protein [Methylobacterium sp. E-065]MCJ2019510.1 hypothetical protein [Methylobacterium sp. E-065]